VSALMQFDEKHPLAVTVAGVASACWLWLMEHLLFIEGVLRVAGLALGLGTAALSFAIKWRRWRAMRAEPQRRYDDDDIPM
jgi:hypothetical protein